MNKSFTFNSSHKKYNVLVPSLENSGPTNMALEIAKCMKKSGFDVTVYYLSNSANISPNASFFSCVKFGIFNFFKIESILHTHGMRPDIIGALLKIISGKFYLVNTLHIHFIPDMKFLHKRFFVKNYFKLWAYFLKKFDNRVCISTSMKKYYNRHFPKLSFKVIYNFRSVENEAIDIDFSKWLKDQKAENRVILVYIGTISDRKNIFNLTSYIANSNKLSLVICGNGEGLEPIQKLAKKCNNILYLGFLRNPLKIIELSDILVLPSFAEGFPLVVIEAASVGKPSLLSDIAVHREIAALNIGKTFDHRDFNNLESSAIEIVNSKDFYSEVNIKDRFKCNLSPEILSAKYFDIINSIEPLQ